MQQWVGRACELPPSPAHIPAPSRADTYCPGQDLLPLDQGRRRGQLWGRAAGIPPLPQAHLPGGQPQVAGDTAGSSLARAGAGEGMGCPGRVKAFQAKIPQQKAGSASELKSKC